MGRMTSADRTWLTLRGGPAPHVWREGVRIFPGHYLCTCLCPFFQIPIKAELTAPPTVFPSCLARFSPQHFRVALLLLICWLVFPTRLLLDGRVYSSLYPQHLA